ncbi:hypothetical protein FACS189481_1200 [Clostridia bacterium]|nr:hypothetical protein FACS189481_1200 [Clostridia bacterium]
MCAREVCAKIQTNSVHIQEKLESGQTYEIWNWGDLEALSKLQNEGKVDDGAKIELKANVQPPVELLNQLIETENNNRPFIGARTASPQFTSGNLIPIGNDDQPFNGTFDGNGFAIEGLMQLAVPFLPNYLGLFGRIGEKGVVKNLKLADVTVVATDDRVLEELIGGKDGGPHDVFVGVLAGRSNGRVENVTAESGNIAVMAFHENWFVGGLIGDNGGEVVGCSLVGGRVNAVAGRMVGGKTLLQLKMQQTDALQKAENLDVDLRQLDKRKEELENALTKEKAKESPNTQLLENAIQALEDEIQSKQEARESVMQKLQELMMAFGFSRVRVGGMVGHNKGYMFKCSSDAQVTTAAAANASPEEANTFRTEWGKEDEQALKVLGLAPDHNSGLLFTGGLCGANDGDVEFCNVDGSVLSFPGGDCGATLSASLCIEYGIGRQWYNFAVPRARSTRVTAGLCATSDGTIVGCLASGNVDSGGLVCCAGGAVGVGTWKLTGVGFSGVLGGDAPIPKVRLLGLQTVPRSIDESPNAVAVNFATSTGFVGALGVTSASTAAHIFAGTLIARREQVNGNAESVPSAKPIAVGCYACGGDRATVRTGEASFFVLPFGDVQLARLKLAPTSLLGVSVGFDNENSNGQQAAGSCHAVFFEGSEFELDPNGDAANATKVTIAQVKGEDPLDPNKTVIEEMNAALARAGCPYRWRKVQKKGENNGYPVIMLRDDSFFLLKTSADAGGSITTDLGSVVRIPAEPEMQQPLTTTITLKPGYEVTIVRDGSRIIPESDLQRENDTVTFEYPPRGYPWLYKGPITNDRNIHAVLARKERPAQSSATPSP